MLVTLAAADGEGGFASATTDLRATETLLRRRLRERPAVFLRLAARNLLAPFHVLARLRWERTIPREGAGYILTIGATPESPFRGGDVLRALEAELAARGMREIWVDTERSNERAVRFYVRNGYEMVSTWFGQVLLKKALPA